MTKLRKLVSSLNCSGLPMIWRTIGIDIDQDLGWMDLPFFPPCPFSMHNAEPCSKGQSKVGDASDASAFRAVTNCREIQAKVRR